MMFRVMVCIIFVICSVPVINAQIVTLPDIDISGSPNGIVPLPENISSVFTNVFSK